MTYNLQSLVIDIDNYITQHQKLNFDLLEIKDFIDKYKNSDFLEYVKESDSRYQKIKVPTKSKYQNIYDIYIVTWKPLQKSLIHDHSQNGCIFKILEGSLTEKQFTPNKTNPKLILQRTITQGNHGYINNQFAFHQVQNLNQYQRTVSLHIYSPSNYKSKSYQTLP